MRFEEVETVVSSDSISDFIRQNRSWLNTQEGFQTHLSSIEAYLTYSFTKNGSLSFSRQASIEDETAETKDFGAWVYIAGQGFYSKANAPINLPSGSSISPEQIPFFIRMNSEELKLVPGFFSEHCPVAKAGLDIELLKEDVISINPEYELLPEYQDKTLRFFDDYVFVEGEGFHELPHDTRLPERFRHPLLLEADQVPLFLIYELDDIKKYASKIDDRLVKPDHFQLVSRSISLLGQNKGKYEIKLRYLTEKANIPITTVWMAIQKKKNSFSARQDSLT